jgi:predicted extracellular nuclease
VATDLTPIDGSSTQPFFDDGTNGDVTAGDNVFTFVATVPLATVPGPKTLTATISDAEGRSGTAPIALTTTDPIPPVVISQVYGGGGGSGALFRNDFIEIFNRGPGTADLTGWSVQYAPATGATWEVTPLSGTLAAGRYYLVQQASGGANGANLPTPDATGAIDLDAAAGKAALIRTTTPQSGSCPGPQGLMDLAGYGTADCFEGAGPAPAGSASLAPTRLVSGCADNDDNAVDFAADAPAPRNGAAAPVDCALPPPTAPLVPINQIQGSGPASPYVGQVVRARGIVTGRTSNSYFLQTPDGDPSDDGDPATSEGVIVFTGSAPTVAAGQYLEVTGIVDEFIPSADPNSPPKTEIAVASTLVFSSGNALPAPVTITAADTNPAGPIDQLEKYEAMRVRVDSLTVVGPSQGSINETNATSTNTGVFYGVLTGLARPFREPGIQAGDPLPPGAPANVPRFDANPERIRVDSDLQAGAAALAVGFGAVVTNLVGPLDYSFRTYTIAPDPATPPTAVPGTGGLPLPAPGPAQFTVGSYNVQRFFDNVNDPNISEPVLTATAFNNRLNKASLYVRGILRSPDILGLQEVENVSTLQTLASKLNNDTVLAGQPNPGYVGYLVEGNDVGGIDVGFLVKTSRVAVASVAQIGKSATYIDPNTNQPALLNDRPPLVLAASVAGKPVTVIVNHLRSLSDIDDPTDGHRVRTKRRAQAEFLAGLVQDRQLADPTERLVVIGDLNAFPFNDGYVDVVGTIKGQPTPPDQVVLASPDLVDPDLVNLEESAPPDQRYSFVFDGSAQTLDHALVSQNMVPLVAGFGRGRGNADSADTLRNDPTRPERVADHDPLLVYFAVPEDTQTGVVSSPDPSTYGQAVTFTATVTAGGNPVTSGSVSFRTATQVLGSSPLNASGQAALATSALAAGQHTVTATFLGSGTLAPSSGSVVHTVAAAATTTTASGSPNPSGFGQPVSVTATVTTAFGPATEGTVTFREGTVVLGGPSPVGPDGQASITVSTLLLGAHAITAEYSGTANLGAGSGGYTQAVQPGVTITDAFVMEGDVPGTVAALFTVTLTTPAPQPVSVSYATQDGTAVAGGDYLARSGQIVFPAGADSQRVAVVIVSDTLNEADETFSVTLSGATGAIIVDSVGNGTIVNDDPLPSMSVNDVMVAERRGPAVFTVSLSAPSGRVVTASFATSDGTATSPDDYLPVQGAVTIPAGATTATVTVTVVPDGIPEPAENFYLLLWDPGNATLTDGLGIATIRRSGEVPGPPAAGTADGVSGASGGFER